MINQQNKYKVAIVGYSLKGGGLEKVTANLSLFFDSVPNIELHTIIVIDSIAYDYGGKLVNLGLLKDAQNGIANKIKRFWFLKKYLQDHKIDFIIDLRFRVKPLQELLIHKLVYNQSKIIYNVHSAKLETYLPKNKILTQLIFGNAYKVVCCATEIEIIARKKYGLKNLLTIYNPLNFQEIDQKVQEFVDLDFPYIIGIGRFEPVKQLDQLIVAYANSVLPENGIRLVLAGDGMQKAWLQKVAHDNGVSAMVVFLGFVTNPFRYIKKARFFVLSSKYEGFGIVLAESLACGTPVISFDCVSGPNEIITHRENGLLVENQDFEKLTVAINTMFQDEDLYQHCKKNARASVARFAMENIGQQWLDLLKIR